MLKSLDDVDVTGKVVLVRGDLNVPFDGTNVTDITRLERLRPTLDELISKRAKIVIISHFGRAKGQVVPKLSLEPIAQVLGRLIEKPIIFAKECVGPVAKQAVEALNEGDVLVLENLRFHKEETQNDDAFAQDLASLGDLYVNDAFSVSHRAHASTCGITKYLPSYAGWNMEHEIKALNLALKAPEKPVTALVGGAKISTKITVLSSLIEKVDNLIIGGAMANTFLWALGYDIGNSLCEKEQKETVESILSKAEKAGCEIYLPVDVVVASKFEANAPHEVRLVSQSHGGMILDVGPETIEDLKKCLDNTKTLLWNGPLGAFELTPFDFGTTTIAQYVGRLTNEGKLVSIAGGGDTVAALEKAGVVDDFSYVSTAGGAFLEWVEGKELPGITVLEVQD